jgi:hypothetical protein
LRAAQHLDPLHIGKIADLRGRARAIDAIDENADRRFDPGVVGAVAEAADDEVGIGRALLLVDAQRGHHAGEILEIADLRAFERLRAGDRDGNRHVLQRLFALGRGDDDLVALRGVFSTVGGGLRLFLGRGQGFFPVGGGAAACSGIAWVCAKATAGTVTVKPQTPTSRPARASSANFMWQPIL